MVHQGGTTRGRAFSSEDGRAMAKDDLRSCNASARMKTRVVSKGRWGGCRHRPPRNHYSRLEALSSVLTAPANSALPQVIYCLRSLPVCWVWGWADGAKLMVCMQPSRFGVASSSNATGGFLGCALREKHLVSWIAKTPPIQPSPVSCGEVVKGRSELATCHPGKVRSGLYGVYV